MNHPMLSQVFEAAISKLYVKREALAASYVEGLKEEIQQAYDSGVTKYGMLLSGLEWRWSEHND